MVQAISSFLLSMNAVGVILGGGEGSRLLPLTRDRAKPAVPLGGTYRLVDIPISNCINNGIYQIFVLTQFNSVSLHEHIGATYRFDNFSNKFVRLLAAQQTPGANEWYKGTADAVRRSLNYYLELNPDYVIILSGDQLYNLDFKDIIRQHKETKADLTILTKPVDRVEASDLGIMRCDNDKRINTFHEKPGPTKDIQEYRAPMYEEELYLASMGIYVFNTKVLKEVLDNDESDFGKGIIPSSIKDYKVFSFIYDGFWKDIGTIRSYWETSLSLTERVPPFSLYNVEQPIYTRGRFLPPIKVNSCVIRQSLVSQGSIISGDTINHCIIGIRAVVGENTVIQDSIVMGNDFFENEKPEGESVPLGIGNDCYIKNAIIDKNCRIGNGVHITPEGKADETFTDMYSVRGGIIVIPKNTTIPDGTRL
jgi:glucose-1-phosphate adenylyltransferase